MSGAEDTSLSPANWAGARDDTTGAPAGAPPRRRLFRKYALLFIALVGAALLINSGFDFWFSYQENKAALVRIQQEKAEAAARRIEEFVGAIERQIGWTTHAQWAAGPLDQRRQDYFRLLRQEPAITELSQLDGEGKEQLQVSRLKMDVVESKEDFSQTPAFTEARAHRIWFSPVYFRKESEPYMTVAMAREGRKAGVTVAEINLKLIWDVITALKIGQSGYAYVVDGHGRLIAHPDISLVLRDTDLSKLAQVVEALAPVLAPGGPGSRGDTAAATLAKNLSGRNVLTAHAAIAPVGWRVFVEVPLSEALAPLYVAAWRTAGLLLFGLIAATLIALVIARRMTGPIRAIAAGAERIGAGEFERRIEVHTGDELEALAQQFNRMGADLQRSYAELEQRVADRTAELSESLDQQTATAEVLGVINASPGDLAPVFDAMLERAMRLCGFDHGSLQTYDGELFRAVAVRGLPEPLAEILRQGTRPSPGNPIAGLLYGKRFVHVPDLTQVEEARFAVEHGSRSILCIPLRKDGVLLGQIVAVRQEVRPFGDKEIALLENFAAQAVIAMENARLIAETREALEQQTATAEVLQVINASPGDLAPVFDAMLEKATRLCGAHTGHLVRYQNGALIRAASIGVPAEFDRLLPLNAPMPDAMVRDSVPERMIAGRSVIHVPDLREDGSYRVGAPAEVAAVEAGIRTALYVPLIKDQEVVGAFIMHRLEVRPFTDKQIALLQNFAAQAVIAIENARLITETREALEQQTATAEVLGVINASPGDLAPVFDAILEKAHLLCGAAHGHLTIYDGQHFRAVATHGVPAPFAELLRQPFRPGLDVARRLLSGDDVIHIPDMAALTYQRDDAVGRTAVETAGVRTILIIALRKEATLLGYITAHRVEVRPFTDKQIALLQNFAAQAVIAMENARLITETREALEQQTATAAVLGVINASPGDLVPVFDAMLEKALILCDASFGTLRTYDGEQLHSVAMRGVPEAYAEFARAPIAFVPGAAAARLRDGEAFVHAPDLREDEGYRINAPVPQALVHLGGARSYLAVGLRKDTQFLGTIVIYRQEVRPFSDKQIALLQNFAAQAVIAMENARLITETRVALEQQTATAEVLGVINSSPGDLAPVFQSILEKAHSLCGVAHGALLLYDGESFRATAVHAYSEEFAERLRQGFRGADNPVTRPLLDGAHFVQIADLATIDHPVPQASAATGMHTALFVALRRDDALLGMISSARREIRPFSEKEIALLQNFAAQAVIAMENARLITETREALEQQTATAEVLGVINSSPGDLAPVFDAILEKAHSLCDATIGSLALFDGALFRAVAVHGSSGQFAERLRLGVGVEDAPRIKPLLAGEPFVHVRDLQTVAERLPGAAAEERPARTILWVALRKEHELLGFIVAARSEVRLFSDKQIALLQNFAAQAVIAMENARLITETREALEQQTATAEVLGVINSSPGDLAPVFDAMLEKATRLCEAVSGFLWTYDGKHFRASATRGLPPDFAEFVREPRIPGPDTGIGRLVRGETLVHFTDLAPLAASPTGDPLHRASVQLGGFRTVLVVPLRKDETLLGGFTVNRKEMRPFSDKQIALVQNFAAQAVIAMENARLITETREALDQQTATAEVLGVINSSPGDLAPVFGVMLEKATRLCDVAFGLMSTYDGEQYETVATHGVGPELAEFMRAPPHQDPDSAIGRIERGEDLVLYDDLADTDIYRKGDPRRRAVVDLGGARSYAVVALRKDRKLLGIIAAYRREVRPFTDKQIALLQNFAAQAVIAIENARLLNELRERTDELGRSVEELQALSEVGQAVSSTLELREVLSTVLNRSVALSGADSGVIFRYSRAERSFHFVEAVGYSEAQVEDVRALDVGENVTGMGQAIASRAPLQVPDLRERPPNPLRDLALAAGYRSVLIVPLVGADRVLGATILQRRAVGEFPETTVRLMQTLAAQSVLAIQNARLFREIADKSEELRLASQHKSQFLANMSHELRTPLNAILGYAELLADGIYGELAPRAAGVLERVQNNGKHLLALINDVLDLSKIEAGQLALTLEDYALPDVVQSVVSATESLANTKGLKFTAEVAPGLPMGRGDARRLAQVLLNLTGNAIKFTDQGEVAIGAAAENGNFVMTVRDTGPGIAAADQAKIFEEFQQIDNSNTRKKGGTGLGLAISKRMVEMQGGSITVDSELGHGATFKVTLPVRVEEVAEELMGAAQ